MEARLHIGLSLVDVEFSLTSIDSIHICYYTVNSEAEPGALWDR